MDQATVNFPYLLTEERVKENELEAEDGVILNIDHVSKSYYSKQQEILAIDDISFPVNRGEFVSIIGPSGCGKTTLLRLIAGLEREYTGNIFLNHKRVEKPGLDRGVIFQDHRLLPWLTIEENIALGLNADKKQIRTLVKQYLKKVDLEGFEKAYPRQLSGGMAQRASIARALLRQPEILLLDEPLGALDSLTRYNMQEELEKIWMNNKSTMIMVTHDIEEAVFLSDKIVVLDARPCKVHDIFQIDMSHPRNRESEEFEEYRKNIVLAFRMALENMYYI